MLRRTAALLPSGLPSLSLPALTPTPTSPATPTPPPTTPALSLLLILRHALARRTRRLGFIAPLLSPAHNTHRRPLPATLRRPRPQRPHRRPRHIPRIPPRRRVIHKHILLLRLPRMRRPARCTRTICRHYLPIR